ncbi:MAG: DUF3467 domain-containing protein [Methanocellales archaeon]|nr:DUF3467 domain-containing protein [Methanocellales archaeon]
MSKNKKKAPIQGLKFSIKEENLLGIYADVVRISHGLHGFTLDFGQYIPEKNTFEILTRIKMSPTHAKSLLPALTENIRKYEGQFGEILIPGQTSSKTKEDLTYIG